MDQGGLMSYGVDMKSNFRRLGNIAAKSSAARGQPIFRLNCRPITSWWST